MSNDTDVFAVLNSESQTELLAAVAYLGNKDRSWRLDVDDVRRNEDSGYSVRLYGWANENSLGNIWITGEEGELCDLARKFPRVEVNGWYKDSYSCGSLYGGEKSCESSLGENGEGLSVEVEISSFRKVKIGFSDAIDLLVNCFEKSGSFDWLQYSGHSVCEDENDPAEMYFSIDDDCELEEREINDRICQTLRSWNCPKDFIVNLKDYDGNDLFESKVWPNDHLPFNQVSVERANDFIENLCRLCETSPEEFLDRLSDLTQRDLNLTDDEGNSILHFGAIKGLLKQIPAEFLTLSNLLRKNNIDQSPISLSHEYGFGYQLPEEFSDPNFCRDYERKIFIENLISNGNHELAEQILDNFPNPLLSN